MNGGGLSAFREKKISPSEGKKIVKAAKENPTKSPADIEKIGEGLGFF